MSDQTENEFVYTTPEKKAAVHYPDTMQSVKMKPVVSRAVIMAISVLLVLFGVASIVLEAVTLHRSLDRDSHGTGFWAGAAFIVTATFCLIFARLCSNSAAIMAMLVAALSTLAGIVATIFSYRGTRWFLGVASEGTAVYEYRAEQVFLGAVVAVGALLCQTALVVIGAATFTCCRRQPVVTTSSPPGYIEPDSE